VSTFAATTTIHGWAWYTQVPVFAVGFRYMYVCGSQKQFFTGKKKSFTGKKVFRG
jgi:hypothetical protein